MTAARFSWFLPSHYLFYCYKSNVYDCFDIIKQYTFGVENYRNPSIWRLTCFFTYFGNYNLQKCRRRTGLGSRLLEFVVLEVDRGESFWREQKYCTCVSEIHWVTYASAQNSRSCNWWIILTFAISYARNSVTLYMVLYFILFFRFYFTLMRLMRNVNALLPLSMPR